MSYTGEKCTDFNEIISVIGTLGVCNKNFQLTTSDLSSVTTRSLDGYMSTYSHLANTNCESFIMASTVKLNDCVYKKSEARMYTATANTFVVTSYSDAKCTTPLRRTVTPYTDGACDSLNGVKRTLSTTVSTDLTAPHVTLR